jgi:thermitase
MKNQSKNLFNPVILTLSLGLLLASCNANNPLAVQHPLSFAYVQTVNIGNDATVSSIESQYQGTVVSWQPEAGFAIVGSNQAPASTVETSSTTSTPVDTNTGVFAIAEGSKVMAGGSKVMAGGSKVMAGGLINNMIQEAINWDTGWHGSTLASGTLNASYQNLNAFVGNGFYMLPFIGGEKGGIKLASAQTLAPKLGAGVKVAIIDTGVDLEHPGLKGLTGDAKYPPHLAPASDWKDFVDGDAIPQEVSGDLATGFGHGTAVAGIVLQIAPNAQIMPIRVLGSDGTGDVTNVVQGIEWAVNHGAKIINLSLGSSESVDAVRKMIAWADSKGVFVVASAGNTDDTNVTYPAADAQNDAYGGKRLISVGSVGSGNTVAQFLGFTDVTPTKLDLKSAFSTYGKVEMYAPGELIDTLAPNLQAAVWTGTSFATPMVSATLALALGEPLTQTQRARVKDAITTTATPIDLLNTLLTGKLGKGRLDAAAFMRKVLN